jgi:hypothetical protein
VAPLASVLPTVLFVGMMLAAVVGVMSLLARKDVYDEIERGEVSRDREGRSGHGVEPGADGLATTPTSEEELGDPARQSAERELEIRQMLEARSARLVRNGGAPLDVEAEMARLLSHERDPRGAGVSGDALGQRAAEAERAERELEIRQMLEARSARLVRNGGAPLDVEAEMARLLDAGDQL